MGRNGVRIIQRDLMLLCPPSPDDSELYVDLLALCEINANWNNKNLSKGRPEPGRDVIMPQELYQKPRYLIRCSQHRVIFSDNVPRQKDFSYRFTEALHPHSVLL